MRLETEWCSAMSWVWPDHIHRDLPLTRLQRKAIHRMAWKLWCKNRWNIVLYLTLPAFYLLIVFFASDLGGRFATGMGLTGFIHKLVRAAAPVALFVMCFAGGGALLRRSRFAPCVFRATRQIGYDVCPRCGYWLRGLNDETGSCPECGAEREPMPKGRADAIEESRL